MGEALASVGHLVNADTYHDQRHAILHDGMVELRKDGRRVDVVQLVGLLRDRNQLEAAGGKEYIVELAESVPDAASAVYYAERVAQVARKRRLLDRLGMAARVVNRLSPKANPGMCEPLLEAALESLPAEDPVRPLLLLRRAECLKRLSGRRAEGLPVVEQLIVDHPDSPHRPAAIYRKEVALSQWAHIFAASIWERRKGEPQQALDIYQESLKRFPNHHFAGYVRSEIKRVQGVIEKQLIDDVLEGIGQQDREEPDQAQAQPDEPHEHRTPTAVSGARR